MTAANRLLDFWLDRPRLDYPITVVVVVAITALALDPVPQQDLSVWYQTLATVTAVLLSLGGVVVTLVFTVTPSDRLCRVYDRVGDRLEVIVMSCLGALVIATVGFALLFMLEDASSKVQMAGTTALTTVSALRFGRLWWILRRVLQALIGRHVAPADDVQWTSPVVGDNDYAIAGRRARRRR